MQIPDAIVRREVLYGAPKRKPDFSALGDAYFEAGRQTDAIESYEKVEDEAARTKGIRRIKEHGIATGDAFILGRVHQNDPLTDDQWRQASEKARALGKTRYVLNIAKRLGDTTQIAELERELGINQPELPPEGEGEGEAEAEAADAESDEGAAAD